MAALADTDSFGCLFCSVMPSSSAMGSLVVDGTAWESSACPTAGIPTCWDTAGAWGAGLCADPAWSTERSNDASRSVPGETTLWLDGSLCGGVSSLGGLVSGIGGKANCPTWRCPVGSPETLDPYIPPWKCTGWEDEAWRSTSASPAPWPCWRPWGCSIWKPGNPTSPDMDFSTATFFNKIAKSCGIYTITSTNPKRTKRKPNKQTNKQTN